MLLACSEAVGILVSLLQKPSNGKNPKSGQQKVLFGVRLRDFELILLMGRPVDSFEKRNGSMKALLGGRIKIESMR